MVRPPAFRKGDSMKEAKPAFKPEYRKPTGPYIDRCDVTEKLYSLETKRNDTFNAAAKELQKVLGLEHFWQEAVPEAFLNMLQGWDHNAAQLSAVVYLQRENKKAYTDRDKQYLVIPKVDLNLLEQQRQSLIVLRERLKLSFEEHEESALEGIIEMLDYWSDERR